MPVRAVGRLAEGPWVGFRWDADGRARDYRLVFGLADGSVRADPSRDSGEQRAGLVAAAMCFVISTLPAPPAELEATQADLAALVRDLPADDVDSGIGTRLQEAVDAIDDGLPGDAVARALSALSPRPREDPVAVLHARLRETLRIAEG